MPKPVLKSKGVSVPSAPPAPSSEPPKAVVKELGKVVASRDAAKDVVKKKRKRKPRVEEVLAADQRRFYKLYSEEVSRLGNTMNQLARIR